MLGAPIALFFFLITLTTSIYEFYRDTSIRERFLFSPYQVWHDKEWYRLFTCTLVHADVAHLAFNMLTFYFFGFWLEKLFLLRFGPYMGHVAFLGLYIAGTLGAHLPEVFRRRHDPTYRALGASGVIMALLFSFIVYQPGAELLVFFFLPLSAWKFAILYVVISFLADRYSKNDGIGHGAHLWGAITGLVFTAVIDFGAYQRFLQYIGNSF
jgi:membrane associated rhomboid family serine protease